MESITGQSARREVPGEDPRFAQLPLQDLADIGYRTGFKAFKNRDDAMETAQEGIARLFAWITRHDKLPDNPAAWMSTVSANLVRNEVRTRCRHPVGELRNEHLGVRAEICSDLLGDLELVRGYCDLPERQREVLSQLYHHDYDEEATARELGIGVESVRTYRRRALLTLRDKVADRSENDG